MNTKRKIIGYLKNLYAKKYKFVAISVFVILAINVKTLELIVGIAKSSVNKSTNTITRTNDLILFLTALDFSIQYMELDVTIIEYVPLDASNREPIKIAHTLDEDPTPTIDSINDAILLGKFSAKA